mgnify:CR=1 FL=1
MVGDLAEEVQKSTATAGAASTITLGNVPVIASAEMNNRYANRFIYIFKGASAGDARIVSSYAGATRVANVAPAWTATPTTTSQFIITKRNPILYENAVIAAIRRAAYLVSRPLTDTSVRVGNILRNGHFEFWDNASNVATGVFIHTPYGASRGWSVQGTGAVGVRTGGPGSDYAASFNQDAFTIYAGKMTSDGTNAAYFEQQIPDYARYLGKVVTVKGKVRTATAARVNVRVLDGVNTFTSDTGGSSGTHSGTTAFQELSKADFTISAEGTQLTVELLTSAGGAVTAEWDDVRLFQQTSDYATWVPPWFEYVSQVYAESVTPGLYLPDALPKDEYRIQAHSDGWKQIVFDRDYVPLDRHLKLVGGGYRTDTIAVTTNLEHSPELIANIAVMQVLAGAVDAGERRAYEDARDWLARFLGMEKLQKLMEGHAV